MPEKLTALMKPFGTIQAEYLENKVIQGTFEKINKEVWNYVAAVTRTDKTTYFSDKENKWFYKYIVNVVLFLPDGEPCIVNYRIVFELSVINNDTYSDVIKLTDEDSDWQAVRLLRHFFSWHNIDADYYVYYSFKGDLSFFNN